MPAKPRRRARCRTAPRVAAVGFGLVVMVGAVLGGCDRPGEPATPARDAGGEEQKVPVAVVEAWLSPLDRTIVVVGTAEAVERVEPTSEVAGRVIEIGFNDEDLISAGDKLVQLDDTRARADLRAADARAERLELDFRRIGTAFERGAASQTELDGVRTALDEARADRDRLDSVVSDHVILAPFDGRVTRRLVSLGAYLSAGQAVTTLFSIDPIEARFEVPERFLGYLEPGLTVRVTTPAFGDRAFDGELAAVGASVSRATRSAEVFARIANGDGRLRPGMYLRVELVLGATEEVLVVPESALVLEGTRTRAYVVEDGVARSRTVRVGERRAGLVEIREGIREGEQVITQGIQKVRDGTAVEATPDEDLAGLSVLPGEAFAQQPSRLARDLPRAERRPSGASHVAEAGESTVEDAEAGSAAEGEG